jgi:hypothetical protein
MEDQFLQSESDHNALNVKLEDFEANFEDTLRRIYHFLGVPAQHLELFVAEASKHDLSRKPTTELKEEHITRGKYDKVLARRALCKYGS